MKNKINTIACLIRHFIRYAVLLFVFITCLFSAVIEEIAVIVNSDIITISDIEIEKNMYLKQLKESGEKPETNYLKSILSNMIGQIIIMQEAKDKEIVITDNDVNVQIRQLMKINNIPNEEQFKAALAQQGIDYDYFLQKQKYNLYSQSLLYRVITTLDPTYEEIREFYAQNKEKFIITKQLLIFCLKKIKAFLSRK